MLAPLLQTRLITHEMLQRYVMGFSADLVYRGHHSYEEIAIVKGQVLYPLDPALDALRDPIKFYEQFLTPNFMSSTVYQTFAEKHRDFFETAITKPNPSPN